MVTLKTIKLLELSIVFWKKNKLTNKTTHLYGGWLSFCIEYDIIELITERGILI